MKTTTLRPLIFGFASALALGSAMPGFAANTAESHDEMAMSETKPIMVSSEDMPKNAADRVLAIVGDVEITLGHVIVEASLLPENLRNAPAQELFPGVLERVIQQEIFAQMLPDLSRRTELQLENERRSLLSSTVVQRILDDVTVSEDALRAAYDERIQEFLPQTEYNASHILVADKDAAEKVIMQINEGADFVSMAQKHSIGPSGPNGGALGWFAADRMVPPFQQAVQALDVGQISEPVKTEHGWHIIVVNDKRVPGVPSYEQVVKDLETEVREASFRAELEARVAAAKVVRADISDLDPGIIDDMSVVEP